MSATIIVLHDPAGINEKEKHFIDAEVNILDWLICQYGVDGFNVPTVIYKNGLEESDIIFKSATDSDPMHMANGFNESGITLNDNDLITIVHQPLGSTLAVFAISFVIAILAASLVDIPEVPEFKTPTESPNNSLTGQTNIARPLQRIPDLYGVNRIYPDLIARSYFEFINNIKFLVEYICVGRGEHLIEDIRSGNTLISDITGSTAEVFEPFTRPLALLDVVESNEVNGQEIIAPNDNKIFASSNDVDYTVNNTFESTLSSMAAFSGLTAGDKFEIIGFGYSNSSTAELTSFAGSSLVSNGNLLDQHAAGDFITISGSAPLGNDGVYLVLSKTYPIFNAQLSCGDPVTGTPVSFTAGSSTPTVDSTFPNEGEFTFSSYTLIPGAPDIHRIVTTETSFTLLSAGANNFSSDAAGVSTLGPFNVPGNPDQVWFDINFPRGLIDGNNNYSVQLKFILQEVDGGGSPIGLPENTFETFSAKTNDPLNFTVKITPDNPGGLYTATVERITNTLSATDQTKWTRLAGVEDITVTDFGNVTTILINTQATDQAAKAQDRKFNCRETRKLVTYENGLITSTPEPTARFADAILNELTDPFMGNKPPSQINLDELYGFQNELDNDPIYGDKLGRFCYSFSNQRTPVGDELKTIANAARGIVTRSGDIVSFTRDQEQPNRTTIFNQRTKKPDSERKSINLQRPNDFNGVELQWVDEDSGEPETITFPDAGADNLKRIEAAGIKNFDQAWNRAKYEFLRIQHQRVSTETSVTKDGLLLSLNDRIGNVDGTNLQSQGGEITAISGLIVSTTERIRFGAGSASVILRAENGDVSESITVTARVDTESGFILSALPSFDIVIRGLNSNQKGTLYKFSPDNNHLAEDHLVQNITPGDDGYVDLSLINYAPEIYGPDNETPPAV